MRLRLEISPEFAAVSTNTTICEPLQAENTITLTAPQREKLTRLISPIVNPAAPRYPTWQTVVNEAARP